MTLAPGIFIRRDVLDLAIIRSSTVKILIQVTHVHQNPVRRLGMNMTVVIVRGGLENTGKWVYLGA